jgi:hypothetical protein
MMNKVNVGEAIVYGINMLGYIAIFGLVGGLFIYVGINMFSGSDLMFAGSMLAATLVMATGVAGMLYKIVADGVASGRSTETDE